MFKVPLPYNLRVIKLDLDKEAYRQALLNCVDTDYRAWKLLSKTNKPLYGSIRGGNFEAYKKTLYGNSFRPLVRGELYDDGEDLFLILSSSMHIASQIFVSVGYCFMSFMVIATADLHVKLKMILGIIGMALLWYALVTGFFYIDLRRAHKDLHKTFGLNTVFDSLKNRDRAMSEGLKTVIREREKINFKKWLSIIGAILAFMALWFSQ